MDSDLSMTERFSRYFDRGVAQKAARSLHDDVEIEFHVANEVFTFIKVAGRNQIKPSAAKTPQLVFSLTPVAAEAILTDPSDEIGTIGLNILKLIVSQDEVRKVNVRFTAGFLTLFYKGYLGVLATGGGQVASFLTSKGLNGLSAVKAFIKKMN